MTQIMPCACPSAYQDARYGRYNRVHNMGKKEWHCTVCGNGKGEVKSGPAKKKGS